MKSFTLAESLSQLAADRATNCATAQGRATWHEIQPLVQPDPPDLAEQIEAKIAAMLAMPSTEPLPASVLFAPCEGCINTETCKTIGCIAKELEETI